MFFVPKIREGLLLLWLFAAAGSDLRKRKIANRLLLLFWIMGIFLWLLEDPKLLFEASAEAFGLLLIGLILWRLHLIGAGDVKAYALILFYCPGKRGAEVIAGSFLLFAAAGGLYLFGQALCGRAERSHKLPLAPWMLLSAVWKLRLF